MASTTTMVPKDLSHWSRPRAAHLPAHQRSRWMDGAAHVCGGTGRASTKSFYTHHVAAISSAIVRADALLVRNAAASLAFQLAHAPGPS